MKNLLCCSLALLSCASAYSQGIPFGLFNATPMAINPAYTGIMNGNVRANAVYRNQWASVTVPYISGYTSVDWRNKYFKNADYFGIGGSVQYSQAGDGNLENFSGLLSAAYHKSIRAQKERPASVALGIQAGYYQHSIDLSRLYFSGPYVPTNWPGTQLGNGNSVKYWTFNAGTAFSQKLSERTNYIVGVSVSNINQPNDALLKKQTSAVGLDMRYTGSAGANLLVAERFSLRPAAILSITSEVTDYLVGSEFNYRLGRGNGRTYVFLGLWYLSSDAAMLTAGFARKSFRLTAGYDYSLSSLNSASNGNGGFEVSLTYIAGNAKVLKRMPVSCNRF